MTGKSIKGIKGFKAFTRDLTCTGGDKLFQYAVGKTYRTSAARLCKQGFHFCRNPFNVLRFYNVESRFGVVTASGSVVGDGIKSAATVLKVVKEISIRELIEAGITYVSRVTQRHKKATHCINDVDDAKLRTCDISGTTHQRLGNIGLGAIMMGTQEFAGVSNSGGETLILNTARFAQVANSGCGCIIANRCNAGQLANSGDGSTLLSSGDDNKIANSGDNVQVAVQGNRNTIASAARSDVAINITGTRNVAFSSGAAKLCADGENNVLIGQFGSVFSGSLNSVFIAISTGDTTGKPVVVVGHVDGKAIKPGRRYRIELKTNTFAESL